MKRTDEPKPCPWCRSTRIVFTFDEDLASMVCQGCGACGPSVPLKEMMHARDMARALWDRRPPS